MHDRIKQRIKIAKERILLEEDTMAAMERGGNDLEFVYVSTPSATWKPVKESGACLGKPQLYYRIPLEPVFRQFNDEDLFELVKHCHQFMDQDQGKRSMMSLVYLVGEWCVMDESNRVWSRSALLEECTWTDGAKMGIEVSDG